ncbi:MAG TPA: FHA domain-containing protein [Blastocatellia bacterium]|nr:FHA domain-containing protein [Blastocatellia bacterium]
MSSCPRCGARNNANLDACRLCGTFLGIERDASSSIEKIDTNSPTVVVPVADAAKQAGKGPEVIDPSGAGQGFLECPICHTANEVGWAFCQHCGTRLPSGQIPPTADRKAPQDLITVVVEADQLVRSAPEEATPQDPSPAGRPSPAPSESGALTEETRAPSPVEGAGGLYCPNCGKQNIINNSYCSGCGGAIPAAETVAMASVSAPPKGRLRLIMEGGQEGDFFELKEDTVVGRTSGDIAFPHDGFMSGRHARIIRRGSSFILKDEGSRNGTFVKIRGEVELRPGDVVLIGKQLFKFEL